MTARFDVQRDDNGAYRFRLVAANGVVVADSQAYRSLADAREGMAAVKRAAAEADVPDNDADLRIDEGIHMHFRNTAEE